MKTVNLLYDEKNQRLWFIDYVLVIYRLCMDDRSIIYYIRYIEYINRFCIDYTLIMYGLDIDCF